MSKLTVLLKKAQQSRFWLWYLNRVLAKLIPFNAPHGFAITHISNDTFTATVPYRRSNFNHIKGIHACALATLGELVSGLYLLMHFDAKIYRIIMSDLQVKYTYQAKKQVFSTISIKKDVLMEIQDTLKNQDKTLIKLVSQLHDSANNEIAVVTTTWQLKKWQAVKTSMQASH